MKFYFGKNRPNLNVSLDETISRLERKVIPTIAGVTFERYIKCRLQILTTQTFLEQKPCWLRKVLFDQHNYVYQIDGKLK
jgi:hypothetical protein